MLFEVYHVSSGLTLCTACALWCYRPRCFPQPLWPWARGDGAEGTWVCVTPGIRLLVFWLQTHQYTVQCRYKAVNFLTNIHKRYPIARPLGRGMGCLLWIQHLIDILPQFLSFLAATKQLYKWYFPSVCLSVRPSVRLSVRRSVTPFWLCSHHRIIMKFSGVITSDRSDVHAKGQGQRSKVKVTEVTTQLNRFRTVTPVWIHIWWWNDAYSLIMLRRGALLFFKVIRQISRSHGSKNRQIWPRLGVSGL